MQIRPYIPHRSECNAALLVVAAEAVEILLESEPELGMKSWPSFELRAIKEQVCANVSSQTSKNRHSSNKYPVWFL